MFSAAFLASATAEVADVSSAPTPVPKPCLEKEEYRQLDFWIGTWDVTINGKHVGSNVIERIADGCGILESWTGDKGRTGRSINFYDAATKSWNQVWVDGGGENVHYIGHYADRAMRLQARTTSAAHEPILQKLTLFDLGSEGVRQLFEDSSDGGKTWTASWDALYKRRDSAPAQ